MTEVSVFSLTKRDGSKKPWQVRWHAYGRYHSRQFTTKEPAKKFHAEMVLAVERGEPFDRHTGLPLKEDDGANTPDLTFYELAAAFMARKWRAWAPKTRRSAIEAIEAAVRALTDDPIPDEMTESVRLWLAEVALLGHQAAVLADHMRHDDDRTAHTWLLAHSLPLRALTTEDAESVLNVYSERTDGKPSAPTTINRKKTQFGGLLKYGVRIGYLDRDPLDATEWKAPKTHKTVDATLLPSPADAGELFDAVDGCGRTGPLLRPLFETLYYAGLRVSEVRALRVEDLRIEGLPPDEWGEIVVCRTLTSPGKRHSDTGEATEERGLKWRARRAKRTVPVPPILVASISSHLEKNPPPDGWVFTNLVGRPWDSSRISRVWSQARKETFVEASPLRATRPYDLRHANASILLAAGVPIPDVAARLGHSADVLLSTYADVINGDRLRANRLVDDYLAAERELRA